MPNSAAARPAASALRSATAATCTRGSRCHPGMWARCDQLPAPTTATRSSSLLIMVRLFLSWVTGHLVAPHWVVAVSQWRSGPEPAEVVDEQIDQRRVLGSDRRRGVRRD